MSNANEQFAQTQQAALEAYQSFALKAVEGFEKLAELNIQAAKATLAESTEQVRAILSAKDPKAVADIVLAGVQPAADKAAAYAKHVYEIVTEHNAEVAKLVEKQIADSNKQLNTAIESLAKSAPAGSEGVVSFVKSAVSAANNVYEQVNKATKQAVELAEENFAVASKAAAPRAARKSA